MGHYNPLIFCPCLLQPTVEMVLCYTTEALKGVAAHVRTSTSVRTMEGAFPYARTFVSLLIIIAHHQFPRHFSSP